MLTQYCTPLICPATVQLSSARYSAFSTVYHTNLVISHLLQVDKAMLDLKARGVAGFDARDRD